MALGLGRIAAPALASPKGVLVSDYLIVIASQFKFAEPLRRGLEGLGVQICEAEWLERSPGSAGGRRQQGFAGDHRR
jgi:hypothetical protein